MKLKDLTAYLFTESHEWMRLKGGNVVSGITDHALREVFSILSITLPEVGSLVRVKQEIAFIEVPGATLSVYAPVEGRILTINTDLIKSPSLLLEHPFSAGWMYIIEPSYPSPVDHLMTAAQYQALISGIS